MWEHKPTETVTLLNSSIDWLMLLICFLFIGESESDDDANTPKEDGECLGFLCSIALGPYLIHSKQSEFIGKPAFASIFC